ncbi:hypothetical protein [Aneurinibacillus aneurinilyticus]|jgi:Flp pilus assembly protein TadB|uniref:hypothetical protein n=1 Tax=Aneurinibacillus aneurinilyticus TaxID=1391 RepID=UPI0023F182CC|nr:hypothetical protein [Aneurinibacillus aneurinilyticus]
MAYGVLTFLSVQFFVLWLRFRKDERVNDLFERIIGVELERKEEGKQKRTRVLVRVFAKLLPFSPSQDHIKYWERKLMQSGYMNGWQNGLEFFVYRLLHGLAGCAIAYTIDGKIQDYLILGGLLFYLPAATVRARVLRRREKARPAFRKMLKLLEVQLEKGPDLKLAIKNASEAIDEPLRSVFVKAIELMENHSVAEAFTWVSNQFDFPELRKFCVLVIVADQGGTPFLKIVREMIRSMDERVDNDIEAAIGKSKLKITFGVIFFTIIPFAVASVIILSMNLVQMYQ